MSIDISARDYVSQVLAGDTTVSCPMVALEKVLEPRGKARADVRTLIEQGFDFGDKYKGTPDEIADAVILDEVVDAAERSEKGVTAQPKKKRVRMTLGGPGSGKTSLYCDTNRDAAPEEKDFIVDYDGQGENDQDCVLGGSLLFQKVKKFYLNHIKAETLPTLTEGQHATLNGYTDHGITLNDTQKATLLAYEVSRARSQVAQQTILNYAAGKGLPLAISATGTNPATLNIQVPNLRQAGYQEIHGDILLVSEETAVASVAERLKGGVGAEYADVVGKLKAVSKQLQPFLGAMDSFDIYVGTSANEPRLRIVSAKDGEVQFHDNFDTHVRELNVGIDPTELRNWIQESPAAARPSEQRTNLSSNQPLPQPKP